MNNNQFYNKKGLEARKLRSDEIDEFAINLRLKWKDQEFTRLADRIWRAPELVQTILNITSPQVGKLEDEDRVLSVKEINKWCKRSTALFNRDQIQEQYFSIFQRDPENAIERWSPYKTYLPGELVEYVPEIDTTIWHPKSPFKRRGGEYINTDSQTVVNTKDVQWELYSHVTGDMVPTEQQPPTQVVYDAFQPEVKELSTMLNCYWMCLKEVQGKQRTRLERNTNETDNDFRLRVAQQEHTDTKAVLAQKIQPRLNYLYMDPKWIPLSRKKTVENLLKGNGWPGSEYWVCLHFPGTGQVVTDTRKRTAVQELQISHKQIWYARASFLSRIVKVHAGIPKLLREYHDKGHQEADEKHLRRKCLNAFSEIDRLTNDMNDLGTVTIDRAMDTVASDMVNNSHKERYQIFYRKDFQNVTELSDGTSRALDQDVWGRIQYDTAGGGTIYGHEAVQAMEKVFSNQSLADHETYIRRVKPRVDQQDLQNPVESVSAHWDERAKLWDKLYNYFHQPLVEYEKMYFEFHNSQKTEVNQRLGISGKFHELVKDITVLNGGMPFMQVPSNSSWSFANPVQAKAREVVADARAFFNKGLKFFELAYKEERDFLGIYSSMETDEDRKMVYSMLRYKPAGPRGLTIRYILKCLYSGAAKRNSGAVHNINSDGSQFFDWGSRIRILFFKFCMYYGLLRHRAVISANQEFEKIYREWETIRLRTWGKQDVPITAFETLWEDKGAPALLAARRDQIWQIGIFQTAEGPTIGGWESFDAHPLKIYSEGRVLELHPNRRKDLPLLHKVKKKSAYYTKLYGERDGETIRWKNLLEWNFIYMQALDMTAIDPNWSRGTSVFGAVTNLREKHERFLIAYLPEYRVYKDDLYGPLVFGRLLNPSRTVYDDAVLHVVAYCERLELNKAKKRVDVVDEDLTIMQWNVNGFHEGENMNIWLSGTKNILTQTITKNPLNQYGPNALTPKQREALSDIYDQSGQSIRKDIEENVREYNELRIAQEKQEQAIVQTEREKEEAEKKLAKLQKELDDLQVQHDNTSKLVNEIKRDAVQSTPGGD